MHRSVNLLLATLLALTAFSSVALAHPGHIHWIEDGLALLYGAGLMAGALALRAIAIASARLRGARS